MSSCQLGRLNKKHPEWVEVFVGNNMTKYKQLRISDMRNAYPQYICVSFPHTKTLTICSDVSECFLQNKSYGGVNKKHKPKQDKTTSSIEPK